MVIFLDSRFASCLWYKTKFTFTPICIVCLFLNRPSIDNYIEWLFCTADLVAFKCYAVPAEWFLAEEGSIFTIIKRVADSSDRWRTDNFVNKCVLFANKPVIRNSWLALTLSPPGKKGQIWRMPTAQSCECLPRPKMTGWVMGDMSLSGFTWYWQDLSEPANIVI
jgi:hypothetical protein